MQSLAKGLKCEVVFGQSFDFIPVMLLSSKAHSQDRTQIFIFHFRLFFFILIYPGVFFYSLQGVRGGEAIGCDYNCSP